MHCMLQGGLGTQVQVKAFRDTPENNNENNDRNWGDSCTQSLPLKVAKLPNGGDEGRFPIALQVRLQGTLTSVWVCWAFMP